MKIAPYQSKCSGPSVVMIALGETKLALTAPFVGVYTPGRNIGGMTPFCSPHLESLVSDRM